jgi:uncharacterized protein (UPF0332 family)
MGDEIAAYLATASESLLTAESEFASGRNNSCANRCYYACFQAAIAALLLEGIQARSRWSHESIQSQFAGQLVNRRKRYSANLGQVLPENQILRVQADYRAEHVTDVQAGRALRKARTFVIAVQQRSEASP